MTMARLGAEEFTEAFTRHGPVLWLVAAAWVGRAEAPDLVQEAARVGWQRRAQFVPGTDVRRWLTQIVRNLGANWRRRRRSETWGEDRPEPVAPPHAAAAWPLSPEWHLSDEVARALVTLTEVARECLLLHVVADHTFAEVAAMLDVPANTVASHVRRARLQLQQALAEPRREPVERSR